MSIINPNKPITEWNERHKSFDPLRSKFKADVENLKKLKKIKIVDSDLGPEGYKFEPEGEKSQQSGQPKQPKSKECNSYVLRISKDRLDVINNVENALGLDKISPCPIGICFSSESIATPFTAPRGYLKAMGPSCLIAV